MAFTPILSVTEGWMVEQRDIKNPFCVDISCSIHQDYSPLILTAAPSTATRRR